MGQFTKKILFLMTESDWGGAQRHLIEFLPIFVKDNPDFKITIASGGQGFVLEEFKKQNLKTIHLPNLTAEHFSPRQDLKAFFKIYQLIKKESPDLLFLLSTKAGFYGTWAALLFRILHRRRLRVIYKIGGWAFTERIPWWRKLIYLWIEKISSPFKDFIIVNSQNNYNLALAKEICPQGKIRIVYNGIDKKRFLDNLLEKNTARARLNINQANKIIVGAIANFYQNKGLTVLLDAINLLLKQEKELKEKLLFVIIGEGQERPALEQKITKYKLKDAVKLTGAIPNARQYLLAFDIFVLPSLKEGFPWAVLEAAAAGLPIIATKVGGVPEIIKNEDNGLLIEPAQPEAINRALLKLIYNENERRRLGANAQRTSEKFSLEAMNKGYSETISQALG